MSLKQDWTIKYAEWWQNNSKLPSNDKIRDFFYSLHQEEIQKLAEAINPHIREIIKREDKRLETSARYNRPFDATVKEKAEVIGRLLQYQS